MNKIEKDNMCTHEAVDLGLPSGTKWATCNVGATEPEEFGDYYSWGETEKKDDYGWDTYIHCDGKYETCHDLGVSICGTQHDVAHKKWGGNWQMPSFADFCELVAYCTYEWVTLNGVPGGKFTSTLNGQSIFLPAAGDCTGTDNSERGECGSYWSGSHDDNGLCYHAGHFLFCDEAGPCMTICRFIGCPVRPVWVEKAKDSEHDIFWKVTPYQLPDTNLLDKHDNDYEHCIDEKPTLKMNAIGIEVPHHNPCYVSLRSILETTEYKKTDMALPIALGMTYSHKVFMTDLAKIPHLIVAGACQVETSTALHTIITSLLYKKRPDDLKLMIIDTSRLTFRPYESMASHYMPSTLDEPIITEAGRAVHAIKRLTTLMDHRYDQLRSARMRNIKDYNAMVDSGQMNATNGHEHMPYVVLVIQEYADLAMTAGRDIEIQMMRLTQLGRAVGIHTVLSTCQPTYNVLTARLKSTIPVRLAFKVPSLFESCIILDRLGAESLTGCGDAFFQNELESRRIQCATVNEHELERVCHHIAKQPHPAKPFILPEVETDKKPQDGSMWDNLFDDAAQDIIHNE